MKLFKCHAVMPLIGHEEMHAVTTYVVLAHTWQEARARVLQTVPGVEFVTVPCAMSDLLATGTASISERELEDLRSACAWNESATQNELETSGRVVKLTSVSRKD